MYGVAPNPSASAPQPYGTAIPIQGQLQRTQTPSQPSSYGSGSAPAPAQRPLAPGTPYRPVQAGPNSMMGYSPSQARGYGAQTPAAAPATAQERPPQGYTPQQQQILAMRQQQQLMQAPPRPPVADDTQRALAPMPLPVARAPAPLRLERTFHPVREPTAPWNVQGPQPVLGLAVQGASLVFQQPGVVALYISVQQAPPETLLRLVNPLTQSVVFFAYGSENSAFLSLVKPVDAGEAWQVQLMLPRPSEEDAPEPSPVHMVAQVAKLL